MKKDPFKDLKLDKEEQEIDAAIERGDYTPVEDFEHEKRRLQEAARNTLEKRKTITIRLSQRNLMRLKAAAAREGVPYQTYVSSLIQKNT